MKKGIIVLLIAVLAAGFAFASFAGFAKITLGADLDGKTFGFGNWAAGKYAFEFTYDTLAAGKDAHETDLWAEIAATGSVKLSETAKNPANTDPDDVSTAATVTWDTTAATIKATFTITKANIHIKDFTFGILNMGVGPDYAKSYYLNAAGTAAAEDALKGPSRFVPGFTVSYKDYNAGFGFKGNWIHDKVEVATAGWVETKAFTFGDADEFSAQAGAYAQYYNDHRIGVTNAKFAGVAVKGGYTAEKLTANASADVQIIRTPGKNNFAFEVSADVTYTINENGKAGANLYLVPGKLSQVAATKALYALDKNEIKLDAKVWANYTFDFDGTKLATEGYVDVRDVIVKGREITVYAKETLTVMEEKLALEFSEKYVVFAKTLALTAKATYTAEKFTAWASLGFGLSFAGETKVTSIAPACGISSTKVIENAEIGLTWKGAEFAKAAKDGTKKGAIEAYATISF